jgi:hypothetical protein
MEMQRPQSEEEHGVKSFIETKAFEEHSDPADRLQVA